ncbi:MAG: DUF1329 domain-containing protein [Desulfobacterales bacterium]|jgi:hypothetical protein|nr:DUF1329 domain-containing protein [Desulfobacterales bacterium]
MLILNQKGGQAMRVKGFARLLIAILLLVVSGYFSSLYAGSNYQEVQAKLFEQIPVKPGDTVNASNWQSVKDLLPPSMVEWVKDGKLEMKIGEIQYEFSADDAYKKRCAANAGKYALNENKSVIDKRSGEIPKYIEGRPFPTIYEEWKNDPDAGIKIMHNVFLDVSRSGATVVDFDINWVNSEKMERGLAGNFSRYFFWNRPDGQQQNPNDYSYLELYFISQPPDLNGMMTLSKRYLEFQTDDYFAYVPSIRRVKKLSGAARSDPFAGSDFVLDDSNGWEGKNESMTWKVLDRKIILMPLQENTLDEPIKGFQNESGAWAMDMRRKSVKAAWEVPGNKELAWMPTNVVWVPRDMFVIEGMPHDKYYNYGRQIMYEDTTVGGVYKIAYDKALTYWKTLVTVPVPAVWGGDDGKAYRTFCSRSFFLIVDDKTQHACTTHYARNLDGNEYRHTYGDPNVRQGNFSESMMGTKSR